MKRVISNSNISSTNKKKNDLSIVIENTVNEIATQSTSVSSHNSNIKPSQDLDDKSTHDQNISVKKMFSLATKNIFPKKMVIIDEEESFYSPILNFFNFEDKLKEIPKENMLFDCKICSSKKNNNTLKAKFAITKNLGKHLKTHAKYITNWLYLYQKHDQKFNKKGITKNTLTLMKYFISSNTALKELKNKWLREPLTDKFEVASKNAFRDEILPKVYQLMRD